MAFRDLTSFCPHCTDQHSTILHVRLLSLSSATPVFHRKFGQILARLSLHSGFRHPGTYSEKLSRPFSVNLAKHAPNLIQFQFSVPLIITDFITLEAFKPHFEVKAVVPRHRISWVTDWVIEYAKETKFGTKVAYGMRMLPECQVCTSHREARNTTLDDEK